MTTRRSKSRARITFPATLEGGEEARVFDLSSGGCQLGLMCAGAQVGDRVKLALHIPEGLPHGPVTLDLEAQVRWRRELTAGVEFLRLDPICAVLLSNLVCAQHLGHKGPSGF